ncbi:MAG: TolC family protein [Muribaculaceae bacterium]|nr:TolC family protein [Muribaculaceae bacterium]
MRLKIFIKVLVAIMHWVGVSAQPHTLSLNDAIDIAQVQSYDALIARLNFMSRYWSYRSYRAELLPSINLYGGLMEFDRSMVQTRDYEDGRIYYVENNTLANSLSLSIDQNIALLGGKLSVQSYLYRLDQFTYGTRLYNSRPIRINYRQPLFAFNRLKWMKKTEPLKYENAKRTYLESVEEIGISVVRLFFGVLSAQSTHKQSVNNLKDRKVLFEIAQKRLELGTITKSELLQLELSMLNAEVEVSDNALALQNAIFRLLSYLRLPIETDVTLLPPDYLPDIVMNAGDVVERAVTNSSHTLEQKISLIASEQNLAQAKSSRGIQLELYSELGLNKSSDTFRSAYTGLKDNEIVGLTLSLPLFDWGLGSGKVRMAKADLEAKKMLLEQAHDSYIQDLNTSVEQFNSQAVQCRNALRARDIADERYDIMRRRFEAGGVSVTDLNTAWQESENARVQYIRLLQSYWSIYYTIRRSTLYDWFGGRDLDKNFDLLIDSQR